MTNKTNNYNSLNDHSFWRKSGRFLLDWRYALIFAAWLFLSYLFPYTGDDWAWGSQIGLNRLSIWFDNYSGRYLGNLIVLALTRSLILRSLVMAATHTGIAYCSEQLLRRKWVPILVTLSTLLVSRLIFRQAIVWTSGFANYATSIFLTLCFLVYLEKHYLDSASSLFPDVPGLLVLGAANCLIVEHFTIYNLQLSILTVAIYLIRKRRIHWGFLSYALGCIAGTALMFSNSVYRSIANNEDSYRAVGGDGIVVRAITNYFSVIYREAFLHNWFVNTVIVLCILILLFRGIGEGSISGIQKAIGLALSCVMLIFEAYTFYVLLSNGFNYLVSPITFQDYLGGSLCAMSLIAMIVLTLMVTGKEQSNFRLRFLWYSALMIVMPLFEVKPIGSRCFYGTYILFALIMCELLSCIHPGELFERRMCLVCTFFLVAMFAAYMVMFAQIHNADMARQESIQEAIEQGAASADFPRLPYDDYLWTSSFVRDNSFWETRYKLFHNIPEDFDLVFIS